MDALVLVVQQQPQKLFLRQRDLSTLTAMDCSVPESIQDTAGRWLTNKQGVLPAPETEVLDQGAGALRVR